MALNREIHNYIQNNFLDAVKVKNLINKEYADRNPEWIKNALNLYSKKFANGEALTASEEVIVDASLHQAVCSKDWFVTMARDEVLRKFGPDYIPTSFGCDYVMYPKPEKNITNTYDLKHNYYFIHLIGKRGNIKEPLHYLDEKDIRIMNINSTPDSLEWHKMTEWRHLKDLKEHRPHTYVNWCAKGLIPVSKIREVEKALD